MKDVNQLFHEARIRQAIVAHYREEAAGLILDDAAGIALDPRFDSIATELAGHLGCRVSEAAALLQPCTQAVYRAALAALEAYHD